MFEQNNVGVRLSNPVTAFIQRLEPEDARTAQVRDNIRCVYDAMDDEGKILRS